MNWQNAVAACASLSDVDAARSHASHTLGALLPGLLAAFQCRTVLEVGVCEGFTTEALARALAALYPGEGFLASVDNTRAAVDRAEDLIAAFDPAVLAMVAFHGDSRDVNWRDLLDAYDRRHADLVLIDGSHEYEVVRLDIDKTRRVLRPEGLMALHDASPKWPGVWRALEEFQAQASWRELRVPYDPESGSTPVALLQRTA